MIARDYEKFFSTEIFGFVGKNIILGIKNPHGINFQIALSKGTCTSGRFQFFEQFITEILFKNI